MRGIISDTLSDFGAYQYRLNTALKKPLYRGISDGFRTFTPQMLEGGVPEERVTAIHVGVNLVLMAASAPYGMLSAYEIPDPSDFA